MSRAVDITGKRFGRLVALNPIGKTKAGNILWRFKCDCGNETVVPTNRIKSGNTKSCGCLNSELVKKE